ncbi:MAG TPA: hypothetical protein ENI87_10665 [bacterium]|nr:hypothetical protein [bacterium]
MRWLVLVIVSVVGILWWQGGGDPLPAPAVVPGDRGAKCVEAAHAPVEPSSRGPVAASTQTAVDRATSPAGAETMHTTVVVYDRTGAPIAGARVVAFAGEHDLAAAVSGLDGVARMAEQPIGTAFRVRSRGHVPYVGSLAGALTRVTMAPAPRLRGRVFTCAGEAVQGARIALLAPVAGRRTAPVQMPPDAHVAYSMADGAFAVPWPDERARDVVVTAAGFAPVVVAALAAADQPEHLTVTLPPGARLAGRLVDAGGRAVAAAIVEVWSVATSGPVAAPGLGVRKPYRTGVPLRSARSGADGRFACADLPPGAVWVACRGQAEVVMLAAGEVRAVELRLAMPATIAGEASAGAGTAVFLRGDEVRRAAVGLDGRFRFEGVLPGRYLVGVARAPFAEHVHAVTQQFLVAGHSPHALVVDVGAGEHRELHLAPAECATGCVAGRVLVHGPSANGRAVAAVPVDGPHTRRRQASVRADGSFRIEGVLPGRYRVRVLAGGARAHEEEQDVSSGVLCDVVAGGTALVSVPLR